VNVSADSRLASWFSSTAAFLPASLYWSTHSSKWSSIAGENTVTVSAAPCAARLSVKTAPLKVTDEHAARLRGADLYSAAAVAGGVALEGIARDALAGADIDGGAFIGGGDGGVGAILTDRHHLGAGVVQRAGIAVVVDAVEEDLLRRGVGARVAVVALPAHLVLPQRDIAVSLDPAARGDERLDEEQATRGAGEGQVSLELMSRGGLRALLGACGWRALEPPSTHPHSLFRPSTTQPPRGLSRRRPR